MANGLSVALLRSVSPPALYAESSLSATMIDVIRIALIEGFEAKAISHQLRLGEQVFWFPQLHAEVDLRSNFASFYAVEHNPDSQIPAAVFELVLRSGGDKQQVACLE